METIEALNWRYAVKKFDSTKKISPEKLEVILESLRLTATSYGLQLMKFVVIENKELQSKLVGVSYQQKQVEDASHLLVLCRNNKVTANEIESYIKNIASTRSIDENSKSLNAFKNGMMGILDWDETRQNHWMENQVYIALGNLLTICALEEVDACPMEGFIPEEIDEILGLQDHNLTAVLLCPIGYRSEDDQHSQYAKVRKSKSEIILHWT